MKREKNAESHGKTIAVIISLFALTIACIVFSVLCIHGTLYDFINRRRVIFSILAAIAFTILCAIAIWLFLTEKNAIFKTILSVYIFLLFCLVLIFIFQRTGFFAIVKDQQSLQKYIAKAGVWMPLTYVILQYLQVVILPIPSVVSTVAGVALFGPLKTTIYSLIGIILGSFTAFFIGRKLGYKAVSWMVGEETLVKWQNKLKGKDNLFLTVMFLLPMFPDDVLCFIAGLSSMSTKYFVIMISFSRLLSVTTTCYSIDLIPFTTWWGILIWILLFVGIVVLFLLIYKNMDRLQNALAKRFKVFRKRKK